MYMNMHMHMYMFIYILYILYIIYILYIYYIYIIYIYYIYTCMCVCAHVFLCVCCIVPKPLNAQSSLKDPFSNGQACSSLQRAKTRTAFWRVVGSTKHQAITGSMEVWCGSPKTEVHWDVNNHIWHICWFHLLPSLCLLPPGKSQRASARGRSSPRSLVDVGKLWEFNSLP